MRHDFTIDCKHPFDVNIAFHIAFVYNRCKRQGVEGLDTFFASPERSDSTQIHSQISFISASPVMKGLLESVSGILAVLNEQRQIVAVNIALLETFGVKDPAEVFGLRPGEAIECIHAHETEAGCGTTRYCSTCGAAISIVTCLAEDHAIERKCAATVMKNGSQSDLCFQIRAHPIRILDNRFVLLFIQDITLQERLVALDKSFFHDTGNLLSCLLGLSDLAEHRKGSELDSAIGSIRDISYRLAQEMNIHREISNQGLKEFSPSFRRVPLNFIFSELHQTLQNHPSSLIRPYSIPTVFEESFIKTDHGLLLRVLTNMVINACEAGESDDAVRVWVEESTDKLRFCVWNPEAIPLDVSLRVFQRHYSTKLGAGRGFGTFGIKLLGQDLLGGQVGFSSSEPLGTTFHISLPRGLA